MNAPTASMLTTFSVDMLTKPAAFSESQLVDTIAELRLIKAQLEKREKLLSEAFKSRNKGFEWITPETGEVRVEGSRFVCTPILVIQKRLDTEGLRSEFGDDWMEEHSKVIQFIQMRFASAERED